ncbi:Molybdopterin molybdenumtransferase [Dermatophilus congolensis]|uniref:Molybdopterin molybdenumtransferase n=2 Tax=Dermatophilus congolensis TaxID=1863 RepID=A0A239VTU9_9MICO|nr:Molybdopterin molybdenumtransferase [Dermatophilus congolensis]
MVNPMVEIRVVSMLSVAEYRSRVLSHVQVAPAVELPLRGAVGRVLAEPLVSAVDLPGFDNSAMDGYAVRAGDVADAGEQTPVFLPVQADIAAGSRERVSLAAGTAMRIMTGAAMPQGADAVVQLEHTDGGVDRVRVDMPVAVGRHVRRRGEDVRAGEVVVPAGRVLGARELALGAAAGCVSAWVYPLPKVLILSTGDELVPLGQVPGFGEVVDSNGVMLEALLGSWGIESVHISGVKDTVEEVLGAIDRGVAQGCSVVISTGGVSMGAYDAVKAALADRGVRFEKVAMMPGKPQGFGRLALEDVEAGVPVFTLPGNPVSAYVSFCVFVLPALQAMAGAEPCGVPVEVVQVVGQCPQPRDRTQFVRVRLERDGAGCAVATVLPGQGSHMLQALADADGLMEIPAVSDGGAVGVSTYRCLVLMDARLGGQV